MYFYKCILETYNIRKHVHYLKIYVRKVLYDKYVKIMKQLQYIIFSYTYLHRT